MLASSVSRWLALLVVSSALNECSRSLAPLSLPCFNPSLCLSVFPQGEEGQPARRMWDGIYTLHYRTATAEDAVPPVPAAGSPAAVAAAAAVAGAGVTAEVQVLGLAAAAAAGVPPGALMPLQVRADVVKCLLHSCLVRSPV